MTTDPRRARRLQLIGSLAAAVLIVVAVIAFVGARLPAIQERSPESHDAGRDADRDAERDHDRASRDADRVREDAESDD